MSFLLTVLKSRQARSGGAEDPLPAEVGQTQPEMFDADRAIALGGTAIRGGLEGRRPSAAATDRGVVEGERFPRSVSGTRRSVMLLLAGETVNKGTRFVAAVVLARALTVEQFGLLNVGIAIAGLVLMATTLGLPDAGVRRIAVDPSVAKQLANMVVTGRILALGLVALPTASVVAVVHPSAALGAFFVVVMAVGLASSLEWLLRGQDRMGAVAAASGIAGITVLVGAGVVATFRPSTTAALAIFAGGELTAMLATWRFAIGRVPRPSTAGLASAARTSWPLALSAFILYISTANLDTLLLSALSGTEEAGLYSAPYRVYLGLNVVGTFAAYAVLPRLSQDVARGRLDVALRRLSSTLWPLAGYGLVCLGSAEMVGATLLKVLFGPTYSEMKATFVLLCAAIAWWSVGFPAGYGLIARNGQRRFLVGTVVAGAVNVVLNIILIPPFGAEGAAGATLAALAAACVCWLGAQTLLRESGMILALLLAATAAAVVSAVDPGLGTMIGASTVAAGAVAVSRGRGALQR